MRSFHSRICKLLLLIALAAGTLVHAAPGQPLPAAAWQRKHVAATIVLYELKAAPGTPAEAVGALARNQRFGLQVVDRPDAAVQGPALALAVVDDVARDYPAPAPEALKYFGRGLDAEQVRAVQAAPRALVLTFVHPAAQAAPRLRLAQQFALELAQARGALIWDEDTRELFTPQAWSAKRLAAWQGDLPDVAQQIVIHAYENHGKVRAVTLGMNRFGLPDLVVQDSVWSLNRALSNTVNLLAQQLAEGSRPDSRGVLALRAAGLRQDRARARFKDELLDGAKGEGALRLLEAARQEGDAENVLLALEFDQNPGRDPTERQTGFLAAFFGAQASEVVMRKNDAALLAASARARSRLPALQAAFAKGLAPGEYLMFKAPFAVGDGGTEWMWIEVTAWQGDRIDGMLRSDPRYIKNLTAGQIVRVRQADVFDYLRVFPDGRTEGNETTAVLKQASP